MKKIFLTFLMLIFSFLPFSFSSNISVDATSDEIIDYFPKSLQLLDLENWFDYEALLDNNDLYIFREISLTKKFILEPYKQYTLVLNDEFLVDWDFYYNDLLDNITEFRNNNYVGYTFTAGANNDIFINGKRYQLIDYFDLWFTSNYDAGEDPDILSWELSRLMILHEGLPKDTYSLDDFKYKHPLDDTSPVFGGKTYFVTNINNPMSLNEILSHIWVYDEEDGFIDPIVIEHDYPSDPDMFSHNQYFIKLQATDSSGNTSELIIYILVVDVEGPQIIGPDKIQVSISKFLTNEEIKSKFQLIDNFDDDGNLELCIIENDYQSNWNTVGQYKVVLLANDSFDNETIREIYIEVIDDVFPIITGPTNIIKNNNEVLTISDIKALFTAYDNLDGDITNSILVVYDDYSGFGHKVGVYKIVLSVTDSSGNETRHELTIKVLDKIPPVFYIDNFLINVQSDVYLTKQQIVDLLIATGQLDVNGITYVNFILNEYEGNENTAGIYNLRLFTVSTDGSEKEFNLQIKVLETDNKLDPIIVETKTFFEKVWNHILSNWYWYLLALIVLLLILKRPRYRRY